MNRGSLAKKTRATEIRVFSIRNKIEDMKVVPIYLETTKMIADLGTKALDPKLFCALRDVMCGYAKRGILGSQEEPREGDGFKSLKVVCCQSTVENGIRLHSSEKNSVSYLFPSILIGLRKISKKKILVMLV